MLLASKIQAFSHRALVITLVFCGVAIATPATAVTIDFEGTGVASGSEISGVLPYTESGFELVNGTTGSGNLISGSANLAYTLNGSDFFGWIEGANVILQSSSATPFSILSFDGAPLFDVDLLVEFQVSGTFSGGGTISDTFNIADGIWTTFLFDASWVNLDSVSFTAGGNAAFDNIVLDTTVTPVPLPAALPLFAGGLGLLGLFGWRRKRMAASAA